MSSDTDAIAAFLASRGVTRVAEGVAALNHSSRDWRKVVRGEPTQNELIASRHLAAVDAAGNEYWVNGLGERLT